MDVTRVPVAAGKRSKREREGCIRPVCSVEEFFKQHGPNQRHPAASGTDTFRVVHVGRSEIARIHPAVRGTRCLVRLSIRIRRTRSLMSLTKAMSPRARCWSPSSPGAHWIVARRHRLGLNPDLRPGQAASAGAGCGPFAVCKFRIDRPCAAIGSGAARISATTLRTMGLFFRIFRSHATPTKSYLPKSRASSTGRLTPI